MTEEANPVADLIMGITMERWSMYSRKFKMNMQELLEDNALSLVVAANEKTWAENHVNDIDRFLKLTISEINDYLGLTGDKDSEDESA